LWGEGWPYPMTMAPAKKMVDTMKTIPATITTHDATV
jgi:hypothetical protein